MHTSKLKQKVHTLVHIPNILQRLITLHQNRITLAAKNRQGKHQNRQGNDPGWLAAKQNPSRIESQGNPIFLGPSRQGLFFWWFGRQVK